LPLRNVYFYLVLAIIIIGVGFGLKVANKTTAEAQFGTASSDLKSYSTGTPDIGGEYLLINQDGKAVSNNTYLGKYILILFGFTFCPDICPNTLAAFSSALDLLGKDAEKVKPIFVTVDPTRDTPEDLKSYLTHFHENFDGFTGSSVQIKHMKKIFRIYAVKSEQDEANPKNYLMDHSAVGYLLGPDGKYITFFRYGAEAEVILTKLKKFL
jgi:protein SCO1/2